MTETTKLYIEIGRTMTTAEHLFLSCAQIPMMWGPLIWSSYDGWWLTHILTALWAGVLLFSMATAWSQRAKRRRKNFETVEAAAQWVRDWQTDD
ncbi:MAG: hypothetical protein AAFU61_08150 [Pseudomonadota bacterium]